MYNPQVGIFWYDPKREELCGVFKAVESTIPMRPDGIIMFPLLHADAWDELQAHYYDQYGNYKPDSIYPNEQDNPFAEPDYTQVRRGRVSGTSSVSNVKHGLWLYEDEDHIKSLIIEEFGLLETETNFEYDIHWDIGHGWSDTRC